MPMVWVSTLVAAGLPVNKARSVAGKVGVYFVTTAQQSIWHPCCDAQIAHEHSLLITQKAKVCGRVHDPWPYHHIVTRLHVTHVSCAQAGHYPECQLSLADHPGGTCPPLLSQAPFIADKMLQMHHRSPCVLPSVHNPSVVLKVLDSTDKDAGEL